MTRRKRLLLCLGLLAVLGGGAFGVWWLAAPQHRINREGFEALREGMTQAEVEEVLGGAPGIYYTGPLEWGEGDFQHVGPGGRFDGFSGLPLPDGFQCWWGRKGIIYAHFDPDRGLTDVEFTPVRPAPEPLLDTLRRWLRY